MPTTLDLLTLFMYLRVIVVGGQVLDRCSASPSHPIYIIFCISIIRLSITRDHDGPILDTEMGVRGI